MTDLSIFPHPDGALDPIAIHDGQADASNVDGSIVGALPDEPDTESSIGSPGLAAGAALGTRSAATPVSFKSSLENGASDTAISAAIGDAAQQAGIAITTSFAAGTFLDFGNAASGAAAWQDDMAATTFSVAGTVADFESAAMASGSGNGLAPSLASDALSFIDNPMPNATFSPTGASMAQLRAAVNSTGVSFTGTGITIGVLSDSFNNHGGAAADEADGALPTAAHINVLKDLASGGSDEGRSMMQILHTIAPGSNLDFYTADNSEQDFAAGIIALANAGAKVICDDVTYFDEPFFQTGIVANAIHTVEQEGVTFLSSAGNQANIAYQNAWAPIASTSFDSVTLTDTQNFGTVGSPNPIQTVTNNSGFSDRLLLQWNQPYGQATTDLGIVFFSGGSVIGKFSNAAITGFTQSNFGLGATYPLISVSIPTGSVNLQFAIEDLSGPDPGVIKDMLYNDTDPSFVGLSGANAGTVVGHHTSLDGIAVGAVDAANAPGNGGTLASENFSSSGLGTQLYFNFDGSAVAGGPLNLSPVGLSGVDDIATSVGNGLSDFFGTSAATPSVAAVVALMLQENASLTPTQIKSILEASATSFGDTNVAGTGLVNAALAIADAACYCSGTLILTDRGEVAVEELAIGDRVVTLSGELRPIKWIGHRTYDPRFVAGNRGLLPVRVAAGALDDGIPTRDLWLSPQHALYVDGLLAPARLLINGATIIQVAAVDHLEYFHIELETHDIIFADGTPAESYVECDNRAMFHNAGEFAALYPEDRGRSGQFCAARHEEMSAELDAVRAALASRIAAAPCTVKPDPGQARSAAA